MDQSNFVRYINSFLGYNHHNGIKLIEVGDGHSIVEVQLTRNSMNPQGSAHGGLIFSIADTAAGCACMSETDRKILGKKKVSAVATPIASAKSGCPVTPILDCVKAGMNVTLGTGGALECGNLDMFEVLRAAAVSQRAATGNADALPAPAALMMGTVCGARAQGRAEECGMLKEGMDADIVLVDFSAPHLMPCHNVLSSLVFAVKGGDVAMTMVRGKVLYQNGQWPTIDLKEVVTELTEYAIPKLFASEQK